MGEAVVTAAMEAGAAQGRRRTRTRVTFSKLLGRAICLRVAAGETVQAICREDGMPSRGTVTAWAKAHREFGRALARAKTLGGWDHERGGGRRSSYCEATAMEIFARLSLGEPMTRICADPGMPSQSTVALWRARHPEFAERMARARQVQAERFCDLGWEIASAVTPADAYATQVKLAHLRWTAGVLSPARFGKLKAVTPEDVDIGDGARGEPAKQVVTFRVKHFEVETQADGSKMVVAYVRDDETGRLVRWRDYPGVEE